MPIFMLALVMFVVSCVEEDKTIKFYKKAPSCWIATAQSTNTTYVTIYGDCTQGAELWYVNPASDNPLRLRVICPFKRNISFRTPAPEVDWHYVIHLTADDSDSLNCTNISK